MIYWHLFYIVQFKNLNGKYYIEVKDKRFFIQLNEKNLLRERKEPESIKTQVQIINGAKKQKKKPKNLVKK